MDNVYKSMSEKTSGAYSTVPKRKPQWSAKDLAELVGVDERKLFGMLTSKDAPKPIGKTHSKWIKNTYDKDEFLRWYKSR